MSLNSDQVARFIRNIQNAAQPQRTFRPATITQVTKNEQGMPVSAIASIGNETNVQVSLANGIGTITHPGETWIAELTGGATGKWRLIECVDSRFLRIADQTDYELPTPQIPDTEHGGIYTESGQAGIGTPNNNPDPTNAPAAMYLYYWHTLPGSYTVFNQGVKAVAYQTRESGFEEWEYSNVVPLYPDRKVQGVTTTTLTTSGTAVGIAADLGYAGFLLQGQPSYWRINSEVMLGIYSGGTIGIVDYTGPGSAVRGEGFVYSTGGRAQPQGGPLAEHPIGSTVELLMGQIALPSLRPGMDYEIKLAFVNQANRTGPWSAVQSFQSWRQDIKPAAPGTVTVDHLSSVLNASWPRVTTDVGGNVRGDIRRYAIARHTAALAGTLTFSAVAALATIIAGTSNPVDVHAYPVPATQGYGNYVGIAAISDNGLVGEWKWGNDTLAPPYPDPDDVTFTSVPRGVLVTIPSGADSRNAQTGATIATPAQEDPGFYEFVLWQASDASGTSAAIVARFTALSHVAYLANGLTGWYKVTSADRAGNYTSATAPNNAGWSGGWKFCASLYAEPGFIENGNFQTPNTTNTDADRWARDTGLDTRILTFQYQDTGGLEGNRVYYADLAAKTGMQPAPPRPSLETQVGKPLPAHATYVSLEVWLYASQTDANYGLNGVLTAYSDDACTVSLGSVSWSLMPFGLTASTWTKVTASLVGTIYGTFSGARAARLSFNVGNFTGTIALGPAGPGLAFNIYIDAVRVVFG